MHFQIIQRKTLRVTRDTSRALLAIAGVLVSVLPTAALASDQFAPLREAIRQEMIEQGIPGMSVAVWKNGTILWEEGFGWADRERRVSATPHTMFALASLSKTLTATGLMTLVQAGKMDLDRPMNDYLGDDKLTVRVGDPAAVTVRRVANHTSGLAEGSQFFYGDQARDTPALSQTIRRYGIVVAYPGERYLYSNVGYGVLGYALEKASGRSYADYMREEVFLPLGMTRSAVLVPTQMQPFAATRYMHGGEPITAYGFGEPGSAAVYSSAHDLARFGMFLLGQRQSDQRAILNDQSIKRMTSDPVPTLTRAGKVSGKSYGVGLTLSKEGGYDIIGHDGSMTGTSTVFDLVPAEKFGLVVLANANEYAPWTLREKILRYMLPKWREPAAVPDAPLAGPFAPTPALLGVWKGSVHTYEGEQPVQLQVLASGDVHIRIGESDQSGMSNLQQSALLNQVAFRNDELSGSTLAQIEVSDTQRYRHTVSLRLKLRGDTLNGTASAISVYGKQGIWTYALPYWTELKKVAAQ